MVSSRCGLGARGFSLKSTTPRQVYFTLPEKLTGKGDHTRPNAISMDLDKNEDPNED